MASRVLDVPCGTLSVRDPPAVTPRGACGAGLVGQTMHIV